jgi:hypothetical protein
MFTRLPGVTKASSYLHALQVQWRVVMSCLQKQNADRLTKKLKCVDERENELHKLIIKHLPANTPSIHEALIVLERNKHTSDDANHVYVQLNTMWTNYQNALLRTTDFFDIQEEKLRGFTSKFFRGITFKNIFGVDIWHKSFSGIPTNIQLLHDIHCELHNNPITNKRKRPISTEIEDSECIDLEAERLSIKVCDVRSTQKWELIAGWCGSALGISRNLDSLFSVLTELNTINIKLDTLKTQLINDPLSLTYIHTSAYEDVCRKCMSKVFAEWLAVGPTLKEQQAHITTLNNMITKTKDDCAPLSDQLLLLSDRFFTALDFQIRSKRNSLIKEVYSECTQSLHTSSELLKSSRYSNANISDPIQSLEHQFRIHSDTFVGTFDIYTKANPGVLDAVDNDFLRDLNTQRKSIEQMCAISDVALYVGVLVNSATELIKLNTNDWQTKLTDFITQEKDKQIECQYMPESFRKTCKRKNLILEEVTNSVRNRLSGAVDSFVALFDNSYTPLIKTASTNVMLLREQIMADETLYPNPWVWPTQERSSRTQINQVDLIILQDICREAQRYAVTVLEETKMQLSIAQEVRFRCALSKSKKFIESFDSDAATAWDGVQSLALTLAEIYVLTNK